MSELDPHAILASLGVHDAVQAQPVTGGADTAIWQVLWRDRLYALRVFRPEQASVCQKEVVVMRAAAETGIPVPSVVRQGMWQERPVLLLSWVAGSTLFHQLRNTPHRIWQLGVAFGRMQAAVHAIPAPPEMQASSWIEWAGDEPELKARLYKLASPKNQLLHLDYHPLNVMVMDAQISGVLDWANARAGDPRADFARTFAILRVSPYGGNNLLMVAIRHILERAWRHGYVTAGGSIDDMALFYAWAGASMIRDLSPRIDKPGSWLRDHHLDPVRHWRDRWKRQAGL